MPTRTEAIRDALSSPVSRCDGTLHAAAVSVAYGLFELRRLMPDYRDKFHLVLANSGSASVVFLDDIDPTSIPHESFRHVRLPRHVASDIRTKVAANLEALEQPREGRQGMDADHVAVCGYDDEDFLLLYRKKLLAFIQRRMGWPLETIPSKVAKLLAKIPGSAVHSPTVRRDYALMASTFTLSGQLMNARRDVCEACGAEATAVRKLKLCGNCKKASYCSADCQKAHWAEEHKAHCKLLQQLRELQQNQASTSDGTTWSAVAWDAATLAEFLDACAL